MKLEDAKEYLLIKSESSEESKVLKDIFQHHYPSTITL